VKNWAAVTGVPGVLGVTGVELSVVFGKIWGKSGNCQLGQQVSGFRTELEDTQQEYQPRSSKILLSSCTVCTANEGKRQSLFASWHGTICRKIGILKIYDGFLV